MHHIFGTCGDCGGPVGAECVVHSVHPIAPHCLSCGAIPRNPFGTVLEMRSQRRQHGKSVKEVDRDPR